MKKSLLILLLVFPFIGKAQSTNSGTEFWMGFMNNLTTSGHNLRLYVSSSYNSRVVVDIPLQNYRDSIFVPRDSVRIISIPLIYGQMLFATDTIEGKGIHITSDNPVSISAMNLSAATTDASVVLPLVNIPQSATYVTGNPNNGANLILLVASADSTIVSISAVSTLSNTIRPTTGTYTIRLNKGQAYQLTSNSNLCGSVIRVKSKSKLVVFSGARCNNWPCGACDHQYEQVLPNLILDTAYCIPPQFGHTAGYYLKIVPYDSVANIKVNGNTYNNVLRSSPLIINVRGDSGYYAASDKLFHCYQFLKGGGCNGYITSSFGDPAMLSLVSTKHFGQSVIFSTVNSTNLKDHFVSVVIPTYAKNNVYLDRIQIDSSEFIEFPFARNFSYAPLMISDGVHQLECDDGLLAYCSGVGFYESYLYLAGFNLPNFDLDFTDTAVSYDCRNKKIKFKFNAKSDFPLKKYSWTFGDGQYGSGNPITHTYDSFGFISVKLVGEDFSGKKDSVIRTIRVDWPEFDPVRNKIICGNDTVIYIEKNPFFANFKWHDSSSNNSIKLWTPQDVWVRATDTSGYCHFTDTGLIGKIDIFSAIRVDTINNCFETNLFRFRDSTRIVSDQIYHKAWVFPFQTFWDNQDLYLKFPMPGKYKAYFDIYTKQINCKARYPIDINVYPNPKAVPKAKGEDFCSEKPILFYDSSGIVNGKIASIKWEFDDNTSITSDSLKTYKSLKYDKFKGDVIRFYNHIVISDHGCTDTVMHAVKVWPKPSVSFNLISPDTIKCLPNALWTFSSTTKADADTFSLKWDAGNGRNGTANDLKNVRYLSAGKYNVKLLALSPFGCHDSLIRTLEVIPGPDARIYIPDTAQCRNAQSFTIRDTSVGKYLNYNWELGENKTAAGKTVDNISYADTGIKTIKLNISSSIPGCKDSAYAFLRVLSPPLAKIGISNDTQCLNGNEFDLKNLSVFSQNPQNTEWFSNNIIIGNDYDMNDVIFTDTGNYAIVLTDRDIENCVHSDTVILRVTPQPISKFEINDSIQCESDNRFVFTTASNPQLMKRWRNNQTLIQESIVDSAVISGLNAGQYRISLVESDALACSDSVSRIITVIPAPLALLTVDEDTQCFDIQSFNIRNNTTYGSDKQAYSEIIHGSVIYPDKDSLIDYQFSNPGTKNLTLIVRTEENCSDTANIELTVIENPVVEIIGDTLCLNETANIAAKQISGLPVSSWNWQLGDGNTAGGQTLQYTYKNPGSFLLTLNVRDIFGCEANASLFDGVIIRALPQAGFNVLSADFSINQMRIKFLPSINNNYRYLWQLPDGRISTADSPVIVISELLKGNAVLRVTDQYGCSDTGIKYVSFFPNNFNVFLPNAITVNNDLLNDIFKVEGIGEVLEFHMHIYNRWGEEVFYSNDPDKGWDGSYQGGFVQEGVYTYLITFSYFDKKSYVFRGTLTVLR